MPITVNHSTPADGTFSATGATAWDANHTLTGVGTLAEQNANAVAITGGSITGITDLAIADGGTGASTASTAFNNLSPLTTAGDTLYGGTSGAGTRLSIGTAGQVLTVNSGATAPQWSTPATGTVTSVGGTGTVSGISLSGTVTSTGNLTLGGTLDLSAPPAIGGTTPAAGTFTTITGQTEVLKGTGQNLFTYSQTFTNGVWSSSTATRADNQTTAPDGTTTAGTFTSVNTTFGGILRQYVTLTSTTYTLSAYVKKNNYRYVGLRFGSVVSGNLFAFFDFDTLATNTVGISGATLTATDAGSGWYRLALTAPNTTLGSTTIDFSTTASDGSCFTNLGAGQIVNIWGVQLEIGSTANTYIPTTTTAVYGTPTLSFSGVAGLGLQSDGSLYASSAGTGNVRFYTNNVALEQMRVSNTTSAVDYLQVTGSATGNPANITMSAQGSDANINLVFTPKGTGTVKFGTYTAGILAQTGYITITDSGGTSRRLLIG